MSFSIPDISKKKHFTEGKGFHKCGFIIMKNELKKVMTEYIFW